LDFSEEDPEEKEKEMKRKKLNFFGLIFDYYRTVVEDNHESHDSNICSNCLRTAKGVPKENLSLGAGSCGVEGCGNEAKYYLQLD